MMSEDTCVHNVTPASTFDSMCQDGVMTRNEHNQSIETMRLSPCFYDFLCIKKTSSIWLETNMFYIYR